MTDTPTNYKMLGYFAKVERQRKDAFEGRKAIKYFDLCNYLGVSPESTELYKQGQLEKELQ